MQDRIAWLALIALAVILIIGGFQGAMGRLLACILAPSQIVDDSQF